jgi:hypothetical protein
MESPSFYLDTSIYLAVLLREKIAKPVLKILVEKTICSSVLLLIESERNLVRMSREGVITPEDYGIAIDLLKRDKENFLLRELTADLCLTGIFPPVRLPRASDLIHLRTALWFQRNTGLEGLLTLDESQKMAAKDLGLTVIEL